MIVLEYPKCSTCVKALRWLDGNGIEYTARNIKEQNPTEEELIGWIKLSGKPVKSFFNTSGLLYKELGLKDRLSDMTEEEKICLLAGNGMLVKRPLLIDGENVLVGFKEQEWSEYIGNKR